VGCSQQNMQHGKEASAAGGSSIRVVQQWR
jgi:hypothetical protein